MKRSIFRVFSVLLVVLMLASMLTVSAFADCSKDGSFVSFKYCTGFGPKANLTVKVINAITNEVLETLDCFDAFVKDCDASVSLNKSCWDKYQIDCVKFDKCDIDWAGASCDAWKHAFKWASPCDKDTMCIYLKCAEATLTYDANQGTDAPAPVKFAYNFPAIPFGTATAPDGSVFMYWTAEKSDKIFTKDDIAPVMLTSIIMNGDKTIYAAYGLDTNGNGIADIFEWKYFLFYDLNGGTADPAIVDMSAHIFGEKVTLSTQKPVHADVDGVKVVFAGWTDKRDIKIYAKNDAKPECITEVTFGLANENVHAVWGFDTNGNDIPDVYETFVTLSFDPNGGTPAPASMEAAIDAVTGVATFDISSAVVTRDGYTFNGWKNGDAIVTGTVSISENTTLVADWTKNPIDYTVTYDANGGNGAPEAQAKSTPDDETEFVISDVVPTREEYTFKGWSTVKDGEAQYQPGETITVAAGGKDVVLYAVWELNPLKTFTVTFDANGGKDAPAAQSVDTRTGKGELTLTENKPTRNGYTFAGWSTTKNGKVEFKPGEKVLLSGDVTLYAVWQKNAPATDNPKTGDNSKLGLWTAGLLVSMMGIGGTAYFAKRKED